MNKPLLKQLRLGCFRFSNDSAPASHYVCESNVCGTNGVDRASGEQQTRPPYMRRVHNRCTAGRACSCECAINRALTDLEMNIDIADGSTPDSAPGSAVVTSAHNSSYGELPFEVILAFNQASHRSCIHSGFDPMSEAIEEVSLEVFFRLRLYF